MKLDQKQLDYHKNWEVKRKNKLQYFLVEGMLYWALPLSLLMIVFGLKDTQPIILNAVLKKFALIFVLASFSGILKAYLTFKVIDKKYVKFKTKTLI